MRGHSPSLSSPDDLETAAAPRGPLEGGDTVRCFHHCRLQHTFAVVAGMGADLLGTEEPGEGIEVGCFAGLAELNGASGDLRTDMASVDAQGTLGVRQRLAHAISLHPDSPTVP